MLCGGVGGWGRGRKTADAAESQRLRSCALLPTFGPCTLVTSQHHPALRPFDEPPHEQTKPAARILTFVLLPFHLFSRFVPQFIVLTKWQNQELLDEWLADPDYVKAVEEMDEYRGSDQLQNHEAAKGRAFSLVDVDKPRSLHVCLLNLMLCWRLVARSVSQKDHLAENYFFFTRTVAG